MSKQKVSAKAIVTDIRSGISDEDLKAKYNLTPRGLESLFAKLIEKNLLTGAEISGRGRVQSKTGETDRLPSSPLPPTGTPEPGIDPKLAEEVADQVRRGTHKNELMVKFGLSPSQLQNLMEELVRLGYLSAEELEATKPRKTKQCPHCAGTMAEGDAQCMHCGKDPNEPIAPAADDFPEPDAEALQSENISYEKYCAWEDRRNQGTIQGYIQTATKCLLSPSDFFSRLPLDGGYLSPILFGAMSIVVAVFFTALWIQLFKGGIGAFGLIGLFIVLSVIFVLSAVFIPISLFLWSLLIHGTLLALKGEQSGFQATFRAVSYSGVTSIFSAIPVVGPIATALWGNCLTVIGIRETHDTTTGKAAGAVLIPLAGVLLVGLLFGVVFSHSGSRAKAVRGHPGNAVLQQGGAALPAEVCTAIESFAERVDSAMTLGTVRQAQPEMVRALQELNGHLKRLPDQKLANEVRTKAAAFATVRLTTMLAQEKLGQSIPQAQEKLEDSRAALDALCGK